MLLPDDHDYSGVATLSKPCPECKKTLYRIDHFIWCGSCGFAVDDSDDDAYYDPRFDESDEDDYLGDLVPM